MATKMIKEFLIQSQYMKTCIIYPKLSQNIRIYLLGQKYLTQFFYKRQ